MSLQFEWNARKSAHNQKKHKVSFEEAASAFADPLSIVVPDPEHSGEEDRAVLLGLSYKGRLLVVVHAERGDRIRIISARRANKNEKRQHGEVQ